MDQQKWKKVNEIVDTALELKGQQRDTFIEKKCKDDEALKSEVTRLLESIEQSGTEGFLENTKDFPGHLAADFSKEEQESASSLVGKTIDQYTITKLIGHGGMGSVFLAERADEAYNRPIALKVMRRGMDTPSNVARFERERNILANLDHPNIARLLDGGVTEAGLPYLVMEYVEGISLLDYCDSKKLNIDKRLSLFKEVCQAVKHAHTNATIHRDLKPSNILVTDEGNVKVLDFGIAKLLEPEDPESTLLQTRTGARMLTLGYAAPEQLESKAITTATDSYTLGILLYELLVGVHPFDMDDKDLTQIEQIIRSKEPSLPSNKFSNLPTETQKKLARKRNTTAAAILKLLSGDLDAIVIKALRKEPESRYSSAEQLLEDLQRREQNLPVIAREDTFRYNSSKFIRRHKTGISVAAGFLLLIIGFTVFYTWQITEERNKARIEAQKAEEVTEFLTRIFEGSNPSVPKSDSIPVRHFLETGVKRINEIEEQPEVKAALMTTMGRVYSNLGQYERSDTLHEEALKLSKKIYKDPHEDLAKSYVMMAVNEKELDNFAAAESLYKKGINILEKLGNRPDSLYSSSLSNLALLYEEIGEHQKAIPFHKKAVALDKKNYPEGHEKIGISLNHLAVAQDKNGNFQKALKNYEKALKILKNQLGNDHQRTAITTHNIAILYRNLGMIDRAMPMMKEALKMKKAIYGNEHIVVVSSLAGMGHLYRETGQIEKSISSFKKTLDIVSNTHGDSSMYSGIMMFSLGATYLQDGSFSKAEQLFRKSIHILERVLGPEGSYLAIPKHMLGKVFLKQEKLSEAQNEFRETKSILIKHYETSHPYYAGLMKSLGRLKIAQDSLQKAHFYLNKSIEVFEQKLPDNHWKLAESRLLFGKVLYHQGNYDESRQLLQQSIPNIQKFRGDDDPYVKSSREILNLISSAE
ncbi:MAG: serine/threonine-protein kinase [Balneolaceae bacterium]|nr:serine/threonine-protein kinase [Balneolaceae bacterium]